MCISIVVIFQHHRREISDGSEHDEDQVGNVISNIACNSLIYFPHRMTRAFFSVFFGEEIERKTKFLMQFSV
jgi:hypothetical protein